MSTGRHRSTGWTLIALGVVVTNLMTGCRKPRAVPPPPPAQVTVAYPIDREVMEWDEFTGWLAAVEKVEVRPRVTGYIKSVHFNEGRVVKAGDLLFVIDPRPYQAELDRATADLSRAKARLALAETEFKRTEKLVPTEAISGFELEERKANLAEAKANIEATTAAVEAAQLNVDFTEVKAEISGRTSRIEVTPGNLVAGGQVGMPTLLTTITSIDPIYCYVDADEASVLKYQKLARENRRPDVRREDVRIPAKMALLNEDEFVHEGYIDFVDNRIDRTTGTLLGRGVFPNAAGWMSEGMFARLRVPGIAPYRTLLVSEQAIQSDQNQKFVLTLDAADVVHVTPVKLGTQFGNLRAIHSGLKGDERVIVMGMIRARPGAKVTPTMAPMPGGEDAETLATTRVVEPPTTRPTTAPTTAPTTRPIEDRAAKAAPAGGGSAR